MRWAVGRDGRAYVGEVTGEVWRTPDAFTEWSPGDGGRLEEVEHRDVPEEVLRRLELWKDGARRSSSEQMLEAVRNDPLVGRGSCSSIDECMDDSEVLGMLSVCRTIEEAVDVARNEELRWLERGLDQREGNDDDPQLLQYREFKRRMEEGR